MDDNVVFLHTNTLHPPQNRKEVEDRIKEAREDYAAELAYEIFAPLYRRLEALGIDITREGVGSCFAASHHAMRAAILRSMNIENPLNEHLDPLFDDDDALIFSETFLIEDDEGYDGD